MKVKLSCTVGDETIARLCPLKRRSNAMIIEFGQCEQDKCEWWSTFFKECSITALGFIGFELMKMREERNQCPSKDSEDFLKMEKTTE